MLIVATAGHIDHGKTSLVRALTGVDTDRLPEERARGISIDLGFAYWDAAPGVLVAFVDVPGHHRFIRNMLAGVAAIDFALLVVAVDDGPMPQTIEHVRILDYLGVRRGVVVLSKADTCGPERVAEVSESVRELLQGTTLADIPALAVSARTGAGLPELKALLSSHASETEGRKGAGRQLARRARFVIDRAFTVRGAGTVVTGTVVDGRIACEDRLTVSPAGAAVRVRGIQVHGREVRQAVSGERAAINVAGAQLPRFARGDWLTDPLLVAVGNLMDVSLSLLPGGTALRHASSARLHLGASELGCRVLLSRKGELEPGQTAPARLVLEHPLVAVNGDRFVLRDGTAGRTVGGGFVVDPCPASRRRRPGEQEFSAMASGDPELALKAMLAARGGSGIEAARFERIFNLPDATTGVIAAACDATVLGKAARVVVSKASVDAWTARVSDALRNDERMAVGVAELRAAVAPDMPIEAFESLLRLQAQGLDVSLAAGSVSLRERRDNARYSDMVVWQRIRPALARFGVHPPDLAELSHDSEVSVGKLRGILQAQARAGEVFQLRPDKYVVRELVAQFAVAALETAAQFEDGRFTAAQYRDRIGTGRTLAIHILELLDAAGVTRRAGDQRTVVRDPRTAFGHAVPFRMTP